MNEDKKRVVVIIERRYVAHATGSVKKTAAGKTVFKRDAVFLKNWTSVEFGIQTDDPSACAVITVFGISGKDGKLFVFFARFAYLAD